MVAIGTIFGFETWSTGVGCIGLVLRYGSGLSALG